MFIRSIKLENILSFGPNAQQIDLQQLNVLIGPNGSGKSNFIDAFNLLQAAPVDITMPIRQGGGSENWIWRGKPDATEAHVEVTVDSIETNIAPLRYSLSIIGNTIPGIHFINEEITPIKSTGRTCDHDECYFLSNSYSMSVNYREDDGNRTQRNLQSLQFKRDQSIFSQLKDFVHYPEITYLGWKFASCHRYVEWSFGRNMIPRLPQRADLPNQALMDGAGNLGLVLNKLRSKPEAKNRILAALKKLYEGITDVDVRVESGSVQIYLQEGDITVPATRLSDGTLRYLCLLAILCNPDPPPLICIEEPELGLHPDILPTLTDLLRQLSQRSQLIVTTHSDILVDCLTETPECVVVCEKENGQTILRRLEKDQLSIWLEKYRLGELWISGQLGGCRW